MWKLLILSFFIQSSIQQYNGPMNNFNKARRVHPRCEYGPCEVKVARLSDFNRMHSKTLIKMQKRKFWLISLILGSSMLWKRHRRASFQHEIQPYAMPRSRLFFVSQSTIPPGCPWTMQFGSHTNEITLRTWSILHDLLLQRHWRDWELLEPVWDLSAPTRTRGRGSAVSRQCDHYSRIDHEWCQKSTYMH